jgi:hypothetical protein
MSSEAEKASVLADLSSKERLQVLEYVRIFRENGYAEHWQVNRWIDRFGSWDDFDSLRAINDHVVAKGVRGISPKFFSIVCTLLDIGPDDGSRLIKSTRY